jgi:drug/metabolite transporter (DMT)-like permease
MTEHRGYALARLLAGAVMISFAPVFVRVIDVAPTASAFYRTLFGGAMLVAVVRFTGGRLGGGRATLVALATAGAFFAVDLWAWHHSIWIVGPGLATLLANFQVFFMALAGVALFGERFRWTLATAIPLALLGLYLVVGVDREAWSADYSWGIALGLLTAVAYAGYLLSLRAARVRGAGVTAAGNLAVASLVSAVLLGGVALIEGESLSIPTVVDGSLMVAYALVAQVLGWVLISSSLRVVPASTVGLTLVLQPSLALVWDVLFFARPFGAREGLGAVLTLFAIWLGTRSSRAPTSTRSRTAET